MRLLPKNIKKLSDHLYEIPADKKLRMLVSARFYSSDKLIKDVLADRSLAQLTNVATLPGIQKWALAMPDMHEGYGFPIGGVAAMDTETGVVSPGGVGYDINCGVRILASTVRRHEAKNQIDNLMEQNLRNIPSGVGQGGGISFSTGDYNKILEQGVKFVVERGLGEKKDIENCEESGAIKGASLSAVSDRAKRRGFSQLGTLGAGNHFLEIQFVEKVYNEKIAEKFGLAKNLVTVMVHCGSRGLGHQVATDYISLMRQSMKKHRLSVVDKELACAPIKTQEGQSYLAAMAAAANYAWANRQIITHVLRKNWKRVFGSRDAELKLVYDVAHNVAKIENHLGFKNPLCVLRKGATRAFVAGHQELPAPYKQTGQPVLIPGTMGTASYVLVGTQKAMTDTFGSVCHGAGRIMSRRAASRAFELSSLLADLKKGGVVAKTFHKKGLLEEAPKAYKDVDEVVSVILGEGLARPVVRLRPLGVIKG